jgi:Flp pilus assembly protein TadB
MMRVRMALGIAGLVAAVLAVTTENRVIFWVAVALLIGSLVVRIVARIRARRETTMQDSMSERRDD